MNIDDDNECTQLKCGRNDPQTLGGRRFKCTRAKLELAEPFFFGGFFFFLVFV